MGSARSLSKKGGENAVDYRRPASGDSAPPQFDSRFAQRQRLCGHTSTGVESMESMMTRSGLAQNTQGQQGECEVLQRYELGEFSLSLDDSAPELCGVNRSK